MKILIAHNRYQHRGGEDTVVEIEYQALQERGHQLELLEIDNDHISSASSRISAVLNSVRNEHSVRKMQLSLESFAPDIVHFHNTFPTMSPGVIEVVLQRSIPIVHTVHNFRLICANAQLMRSGVPCEACVGHWKLPGIVHRCYRNSVVGSAVSSAVATVTKGLAIKFPLGYNFIALSNFAKGRLVADGIAPAQIHVKGNTVPDLGIGDEIRKPRIIFTGRLSPEKGVETLLRLAPHIRGELDIIGDGPQAPIFANAPPNVHVHGRLPRNAAIARVKTARAIVVPSKWYEGFPMVIAEAMATGTPTIASRLGALPEIVTDGVTGLIVDPNDDEEWLSAINRLLRSEGEARQMGANARNDYVTNHAIAPNMTALEAIYQSALSRVRQTKEIAEK